MGDFTRAVPGFGAGNSGALRSERMGNHGSERPPPRDDDRTAPTSAASSQALPGAGPDLAADGRSLASPSKVARSSAAHHLDPVSPLATAELLWDDETSSPVSGGAALVPTPGSPSHAPAPPPRTEMPVPDVPYVDAAALIPTPEVAELAPLQEASGAAEVLFGGADDIDGPAVESDLMQEKTIDVGQQALLQQSDAPISLDDSLTVEGAPLLDSRAGPAEQVPQAGDVLVATDGSRVLCEALLGDQRGQVYFRARVEGEEQGYTAVWMSDPPVEPPWSHLPDPRIVRPRCLVSLEGAAVRVFERPKGNTVVDYLFDSEPHLPAMAAIELGIELAEILEGLHGAGLFLYDLDPGQLVVEKTGRVRLYAVKGFCAPGRAPPQPGVFAAPEVRRRMGYLMGAHSDVFAVALLLYALLSRRSTLDVELDPSMLPSPRTFRPDCPLGIWPYLAPCLAASPATRIGHARGLRHQLELARSRILEEARAAEEPPPVLLEAWAELHTGLGKARRGADQQDRALAVTEEDGRIGLYLIADGVSRSRYGDGAFAAEQIEGAALDAWETLESRGPDAMALAHEARTETMRQIARNAGVAIAAEVNTRHAPIANEPNQVMSATLVAAFIVDGEATIANLGDSRAYLIRSGTIERITIDHDRVTDALRMGLSFQEAADVRMGTALTRVVGRVIIDENGQARSDPFDPENFRLRLLPGDRMLLCSDGVADFAAGAGATQVEAEKKMLECVLTYDDPARAAYELVVLANRAGGYDNISCVVVRAREP
ncbi:MAG: PP2C family protein-serine/threonine phosphatase [Myxococcota bacterium]